MKIRTKDKRHPKALSPLIISGVLLGIFGSIWKVTGGCLSGLLAGMVFPVFLVCLSVVLAYMISIRVKRKWKSD